MYVDGFVLFLSKFILWCRVLLVLVEFLIGKVFKGRNVSIFIIFSVFFIYYESLVKLV